MDTGDAPLAAAKTAPKNTWALQLLSLYPACGHRVVASQGCIPAPSDSCLPVLACSGGVEVPLHKRGQKLKNQQKRKVGGSRSCYTAAESGMFSTVSPSFDALMSYLSAIIPAGFAQKAKLSKALSFTERTESRVAKLTKKNQKKTVLKALY